METKNKSSFKTLFALTIFSIASIGAFKSLAVENAETTIKCPDGNKYDCATVTDDHGTFVARKGDGGTVVQF